MSLTKKELIERKFNSYFVEFVCANCHRKFSLSISKGTPVGKITQCPNCGCAGSNKQTW